MTLTATMTISRESSARLTNVMLTLNYEVMEFFLEPKTTSADSTTAGTTKTTSSGWGSTSKSSTDGSITQTTERTTERFTTGTITQQNGATTPVHTTRGSV